MRINLIELEQTCGACPSQWEGTTSEDEEFYARFRHGIFRIDIDGKTIIRQEHDGEYGGGLCSWDDVVEWAADDGYDIFILEED